MRRLSYDWSTDATERYKTCHTTDIYKWECMAGYVDHTNIDMFLFEVVITSECVCKCDFV